MLTKADDYPVHQRPEPVATAGSDRNFYDRYYFQGYNADQTISFGASLGVYPHLDLLDAVFMIQHNGQQHSLYASRHLNSERMDTVAGPISVEVIEPLQCLRLKVTDNEHGIAADLTFNGLVAPIEEPRFTYRAGPRTILDLTRMTQGGTWQGTVGLGAETFNVSGWRGTRDRSWGIRPLGARDLQPMPGAGLSQWFWLWAPMHFDDYLVFFHTNDDVQGKGWNRSAMLVPLDGRAPLELMDVGFSVTYRSGTRQIAQAVIHGRCPDGTAVKVELEGGQVTYKQGEGYNHPVWGHGSYHGALAVHHETLDVQRADPNDMAQVHLHTYCTARLSLGNQAVRPGQAVLEQMIVGAHQPSGFQGMDDLAR